MFISSIILTTAMFNRKVWHIKNMVQCKKCRRVITDYPCPHCGEEQKIFFSRKGTGRP